MTDRTFTRRDTGATLAELLVTLAVISLTLTISITAFVNLVQPVTQAADSQSVTNIMAFRERWQAQGYSIAQGDGDQAGSLVAFNDANGNGTLDAGEMAFETISTAGLIPTAPTSVAFAQTDTSSGTITWAAPNDAGTAAVTSYRVTLTNVTNPADTVSYTTSSTTLPVTGLPTGSSYTTTVQAVTAAGTTSTVSPAAVFRTASLPSYPTGLTATFTTSGTLNLTWTAPAVTPDSPLTGYRITRATDAAFTTGVTSVNRSAASTTATLTGLTPDITHHITVTALTLAGPGSPSTPATALWSTVPDAPTSITTVAAGTTTATITWEAPDGNGAPVTDYRIDYAPTGTTNWTTTTEGLSAATTATATALTPGTTYTIRVHAISSRGSSTWGTATYTQPAVLPGTPTSPALTVASPTTMSLTWTAPASTGGAPITSYRITRATNAAFTANLTVIDTGTNATSHTFTGLNAGAGYYVKIAATTTAGTGTQSTTANKLLATAPAAPTNLTVTAPTSTSLYATWTTATYNGSVVTDYIVEYSTDGTTWTTYTDGVTATTNTTLTGLTSGATYQVRVYAKNAIATGPASTTATRTLP